MAYVTPVAAGELGDPNAVFVPVETDDCTLHPAYGTPGGPL
jgi:hypothetical protein